MNAPAIVTNHIRLYRNYLATRLDEHGENVYGLVHVACETWKTKKRVKKSAARSALAAKKNAKKPVKKSAARSALAAVREA